MDIKARKLVQLISPLVDKERLVVSALRFERFIFLRSRNCAKSDMYKNCTLSGGHNESVLSLDINIFGVLASGSEDCLCVWNSDGTPSTKINSPNDSDIAGVCFSKQKPEELFFSAGTKIFNYDLRSMSSPLCEFEYNEDEINQIVVHDKGQYLAACDDTGAVKVIDLHQKKLFKTLNRSHTNICSSVQFRPQRPWDLVTGGMDFKVVYWDFSTGRASHEVNIQDTGTEDDKYFINPPFVHSVHLKENSKDFAVGLGGYSGVYLNVFIFILLQLHVCSLFFFFLVQPTTFCLLILVSFPLSFIPYIKNNSL